MEFIYVVTLNGTAIDAQTAIDSLDMITEQEMAILLGHVVTLKAQRNAPFQYKYNRNYLSIAFYNIL